jgi:hypothetical protein
VRELAAARPPRSVWEGNFWASNQKDATAAVSQATRRVSRAIRPWLPVIEQAAATAVHMHGYEDQRFVTVEAA